MRMFIIACLLFATGYAQTGCPAPDSSKALTYGKTCLNDNCINSNARYWSLGEAWAACATVPECGFMFAFGNKWFLRRINDPDTPGFTGYVYECPGTTAPVADPTSVPTRPMTSQPVAEPTIVPIWIGQPVTAPTTVPSMAMTSQPVAEPTSVPTLSQTFPPEATTGQPVMKPTSIPTLAQLLGDQVTVVMAGDGITSQNKDQACESVAGALAGTVAGCAVVASRRRLTTALIVDVNVNDAQTAVNTANDANFPTTLQNWPPGATVTDVTATVSISGTIGVVLSGTGMTSNNIASVCTAVASEIFGGIVIPDQCYFLPSDQNKLYAQIGVADLEAAELLITGTWFEGASVSGFGVDLTDGVQHGYVHGDAFNYYMNIQVAKDCNPANSDASTGVNSDCQTGGEPATKQGAYCDSATGSGKCLMCPVEGCPSAVSSLNIGSLTDCEKFCNNKAVLASATVNTQCTVNTRSADCGVATGASGTFCIGGIAGVCASCELLDRDSGHLACFDYPGFDIATQLGCVAVCEGDEYVLQTQTDVNAEQVYITEELSRMEDSGSCPEDGCCAESQFGTWFGDGSLCTDGAESAVPDGAPGRSGMISYDSEIPSSNNCYESRSCGEPSKGQDPKKCYVNFHPNGAICLVVSQPFGSTTINLDVPGRCLEGNCALYPSFDSDDLVCPPDKPIKTVTPVEMRSCGGDVKTASRTNLQKTHVPLSTTANSGKVPAIVGDANKNVVCYSSTTTQDLVNQKIDALFDIMYIDPYTTSGAKVISYYVEDDQGAITTPTISGRCIAGSNMVPDSYFQGTGSGGMSPTYTAEDPNCIITAEGYYKYRQQDISFRVIPSPSGCTTQSKTEGKPVCTEMDTLLTIGYQTKFLVQVMACPMIDANNMAVCRGSMTCQFQTGMPCNGAYHTCSPMVSSHGDPIIWTFNNECYDLSKDGMYSAAEVSHHSHTVEIAVYNDYMRDIQVLDEHGNVWLSVNNLGEVMNNDYPYSFTEVIKECPEDMHDCIDTYTEYEFDALDFNWVVEVLRHDYNDNGLKEGDFGFHLDIYPRPYGVNFLERLSEYKGLYFANPLPEELEFCPEGSSRND